MLPWEEEFPASLLKSHPALVSVANRAQAFALSTLQTERFRVSKRRGLRRPTLALTAGLLTKATKQHRAVQLLTMRGLGQDAATVTRALFETMLAIHFLLAHRVTPRTFQQGKVIRIAPIPRRPLTTVFRTKLFIANSAFEQERMYESYRQTRGLRRRASGYARSGCATAVKESEARIGPQWTRRLKGSKSYAGLPLRDLALTLGFAHVYATLYRVGSWHTHVVDFHRHVNLDRDGVATLRLLSDIADVPQALHGATTLLVMSYAKVTQRLGEGWDADIAELAEDLNRCAPQDTATPSAR